MLLIASFSKHVSVAHSRSAERVVVLRFGEFRTRAVYRANRRRLTDAVPVWRQPDDGTYKTVSTEVSIWKSNDTILLM